MSKVLKKKNIDFYAAYYRKPPADKETVKKRIIYGIPGGVAAVMLIAGGVIYGQIIYNNVKVNEVVEYLNQPDIQTSYEAAKAVVTDKESFQGELDYFTGVEDNLGTYPVLTSDDITRVYASASGGTSIQGIGYDSETGVLTVNAEAPQYKYAAQTVSTLRGLGIFSDVEYSGYESATTGVYYFEAYCLMEGGGNQ